MNIQRNSHQLKHNDDVTGLFALGPLQIRIPDYAHAQILAMTNHWTQLYNLVLHDVFKMIITKLFVLTYLEKIFAEKF